MHPQLGYQFALDRGRELQAAAEADRLARSVRNPGKRWWQRSSAAPPLHEPVPAVVFPQTIREVLDEVAAVVEALGPRAVGEEAAPVVRCLVEEVLAVAKEAGLTDLPTGPRPGEPAVVGYRTLAKVGSKTSTMSEIVLAPPDARRIGFTIADLRALGRFDGPGQADPAALTSISQAPISQASIYQSPLRRLRRQGRVARLFGTQAPEQQGRSVGDDCVTGLQVCA